MAKGSFYNHFPPGATTSSHPSRLSRKARPPTSPGGDRRHGTWSSAVAHGRRGLPRRDAGAHAGPKRCWRSHAPTPTCCPRFPGATTTPPPLMTPDMAELGWPDPGAVAVLTVAMIAETALIELMTTRNAATCATRSWRWSPTSVLTDGTRAIPAALARRARAEFQHAAQRRDPQVERCDGEELDALRVGEDRTNGSIFVVGERPLIGDGVGNADDRPLPRRPCGVGRPRR